MTWINDDGAGLRYYLRRELRGAMSPDRIREHAKQAREAAKLATDPMTKARLHEIANDLEKLANQLEGQSDPESDPER